MEGCPRCHKPEPVCVCDRASPLAVRSRVLVLQHPQEQDRILGTVPILERMVGATRAVGLSWPNLAAARDGAARDGDSRVPAREAAGWPWLSRSRPPTVARRSPTV